MRALLLRYFRALLRRFGPQGWWPGDTPFEIAVGAILTQNAAWANVEKAIANLKGAGVLSWRRMRRLPRRRLAALIRPSGYFNLKAARLGEFLRFLGARGAGSVRRLTRGPLPAAREALLSVRGIGPETADSILLYAGQRPVFVVDAYTRRVLSRHGLLRGGEPYGEIRALFERNLPEDPALYNEYHALLVAVGKEFCRKGRPRCEHCPLRPYLPPYPSSGFHRPNVPMISRGYTRARGPREIISVILDVSTFHRFND